MTTETITSTAPKWRGWIRRSRRARWELYCQSENEDEMRRLLIYEYEGPPDVEKYPARGDVDPNKLKVIR